MQHIFYEGHLTDYEKTIYGMAIAHSSSYTYVFKDEDVNRIASLLNVDYELFDRAIKFSQNGYIPAGQLKLGDVYYCTDCLRNAELLNTLIRIYFIYKSLENLSDGTGYDDILNNFQLFQSCIGEFESINASISAFECMSRGFFSLDFAVYNNGDYNPKKQLDLLHYFLIDGLQENLKEYFFDPSYPQFLYRLLSYDLITRINSIYLITITLIIKYSYFLSNHTKNIAEEMYSYLFGTLQNARVISAQTNYLFPSGADDIEHRGKENNTTRLQILYGYQNYDTYFLRLDLAHKGQGFIHYNNKSPGGVKTCLFTKKEYDAFVLKYAQSSRFFIQYGNRYALKELINLNLTDEEVGIFEEIRKTKEHLEAFNENYSEEYVEEFIGIVSCMLPNTCVVGIDLEEEHARRCFNYDKIMFNSVILDLAILSRDKEAINKCIENIVSLAQHFNLISEGNVDSLKCIEGVCLIIDEAKNHISLYRDIL